MPERFCIIGSSRASVASEATRDMVLEAVRATRGGVEPAAWREFADRLRFVAFSEDEGGELARPSVTRLSAVWACRVDAERVGSD